jgi:hypothetical protein
LDVISATSSLLVTTTAGTDLPASVVWDGRGLGSGIVGSGAYSCTLVVTASNGLAAGSDPQVVWVVGGPPPALEITMPGEDVTTKLSQTWVAGSAEPGSTLYYGPYSGSFSVQAQAADGLAGLDTFTFPDTISGGHTYTLAGASSATRTWAYDFTAASSFEGAIPVAATDRATNEGTAGFTLVRDATPPAVAVTATMQAEDIHVTWEAKDTISDLGACSLEVDTGDGSPEELSTSCNGKRLYTQGCSVLHHSSIIQDVVQVHAVVE